jgi:tRNA dimethylallyltransferase
MADSNPFHRAIYLTGPTASGKTAIGVRLAQRLGAEIIALDSMTLYRGMDIGTAKPTLAERCGVPHHLIDVLDSWQSASVADYRAWAATTLAEIEARDHRALFVGGTALYLKALLRGLFEGPGADPERRKSLEQEAERLGDASLHARLRALDPVAAARLHPNDRRRVIRALEIVESTGRPLSAWQTEHSRAAPASVPVFALDRPRPELHERIDCRVEQMFSQGLVEEVQTLLAAPGSIGPVPAQAVGYREVIGMLQGEATLEETIVQVQRRTRQFAKRQMTWFRHLAEVRLIPISAGDAPESMAERLAALVDVAN